MAKKDYTDVLLEDINHKFDFILEAVGGMQDNVKKIPKMAERIEKIESDMIAVKLSTMSINPDLKLIKIRTEKLEDIKDEVKIHAKRITKLEAATQA